tara:strand:+ start:1328 stop:2185 length:858 start_codon:yes stop_codon:yes gene_type:complete
MILWLASYPKSGNTMLRSLLSAYFYTKDGNFNFEVLKKINQFPDITVFEKLKFNTDTEKEIVKNYIKAQEEINKQDKKSLRFLKTHSTMHNIAGYKFTDLRNSLGVIYIVRDPRNIVKSYANHNQFTIEESVKALTSFRMLGGIKNAENSADRTVTHVGTWSSHFNTWKEFDKVNKYLLIKYEDLVSDTEKIFIKILEFIYKLVGSKFVLDELKLKNVIKTTSFENLKQLEKENSFHEAKKDSENQPVTFFKYGFNKDGKIDLPENFKKQIEDFYKKELLELGYL